MNTAALHPLAAPPMRRIFLFEAWYELLRVLRTPAFSLPTLAFPLMFYVLFALVLPGQWGGFHKATYLFATYTTFGVMGPALFGFGVGLAIEREQGWLELKRVSPMPAAAYFAAKIAMSLAFAAAIIVLLALAAFGFGGVRMPPAMFLLLSSALLLGVLPFCAFGLWIGTLVKGQAAVAVVNLVYMPMALLSGLWFPLHVFPPLLQKLAPIWPAWHLGQITLGIVGQLDGVRYGMHAAALLAATALFLSLAALRLRRMQP